MFDSTDNLKYNICLHLLATTFLILVGAMLLTAIAAPLILQQLTVITGGSMVIGGCIFGAMLVAAIYIIPTFYSRLENLLQKKFNKGIYPMIHNSALIQFIALLLLALVLVSI